MSPGRVDATPNDSQWNEPVAAAGSTEVIDKPESIGDVGETLAKRVEELLASYRRRELLSTTGTLATVDELVIRNAGLEEAVRTLARELQDLYDRFEGRIEQLKKAPPHPRSSPVALRSGVHGTFGERRRPGGRTMNIRTKPYVPGCVRRWP